MERGTFGLEEETIRRMKEVLSKYPVEKAIIYGSRAKGQYRPESDIDLVLTGSGVDFPVQLAIATEFDDLLLPVQIDLSILQLIENKLLLDHINREGKIFYKQN